MGDADVTLASYDETSMTITIQKPSGDIVINAEAIGSAIKKNYETKIDLTSISWKFNKLRDESTETFDTTMMASDYDDSSWTSITLPYDWSVYNSFDSTISGNEYESGWLAGGDAIYRAKVTIPSDYNGNKIYIHFDGVYMTSEIYINGTSVGTNKNGYIPFNFDITEYVTYGAENTIAVAVSNHLPSSRWYSGSGIYRNCWISMVNVPELGIEDITITSPNLATEHTGTVETDVKFDIESISSNDITLSEIKACIY
jgi:beta-galactosidase